MEKAPKKRANQKAESTGEITSEDCGIGGVSVGEAGRCGLPLYSSVKEL